MSLSTTSFLIIFSATLIFNPHIYQSSILYHLYDFMEHYFKHINYRKTPEISVY
jgi:hypothetical protein